MKTLNQKEKEKEKITLSLINIHSNHVINQYSYLGGGAESRRVWINYWRHVGGPGPITLARHFRSESPPSVPCRPSIFQNGRERVSPLGGPLGFTAPRCRNHTTTTTSERSGIVPLSVHPSTRVSVVVGFSLSTAFVVQSSSSSFHLRW